MRRVVLQGVRINTEASLNSGLQIGEERGEFAVICFCKVLVAKANKLWVSTNSFL